MTVHQQAEAGSLAAATPVITVDSATHVVPDAHLLFNGAFRKLGPDLLIELGEQRALISDYFGAERPVPLYAPGGAILDGDTVHALAGVGSLWVLAQAGGGVGAAAQIGTVRTLNGSATVQRAGATTQLATGQPVFQGDVVETAAGASLGIVLRDNTVFSLSGGSRMVMSSLVYDAGRTDNSMSLSLVQGAFTFVTGQVAKTGSVSINTPVSTMGIRGTTPIVRLSAVDGSGEFSLAADPPEAGGAIGSYTLTSPTGSYAPVTVATTDIIIRIQTGAGPVQQSLKSPTEQQGDALLAGALYQLYQLLGPQQPTDPRAPGQRGDLGSGGQTIVDLQGLGTKAFTDLLSDLLTNTALKDPNGIVLEIFGQEYRLLAPALPGSLRAAVDLDVLTPGPDFQNTFVEDGTGSFITGATLITAPGGTTISSVTVLLQGPTTPRLDNLLIGDFTPDPLVSGPQSGFLPNGVAFTVVFGSVDVILTPGTSAGTISDFQAAIQAIRFINTSQDPDTTPRTVIVTVTLSDGSQASATTTIQVIPVNDAPVAEPLTVSVEEDGSVTGQLVATDVDSTGLTFAAVTQPTNGTLVVDPDTGAFTYTPNANFNGTDSFTFVSSDGEATSAPQTVTINVGAVNDAPVADSQNVAVNEDAELAGIATGSDIDGDMLSFGVVTGPQHGSLSFDTATGAFLYTPTANFNGSDSFTFRANDGTANSANVATVSITVNSVDDLPVAVDDDYKVDEDSSVASGSDVPSLAANDTPSGDGGNVWSLATQAAHGTAVVNVDGTFSYTPNANFFGTDSFTYQITDVDGDVSLATVSITVNPVNDGPLATITPTSYTATEQIGLQLKGSGLSISDVDAGAGPVTVTVSVGEGVLLATSFSGGPLVSGSGTGTLTISGNIGQINAFLGGSAGTGSLHYLNPSDAPSASTTLTLSVDDGGNTGAGGALSASDTATINITAVNDAPAGADRTIATDEDTSYVLTTADFGFTDSADTPPNNFAGVVITTLPGAGVLDIEGAPIGAGAIVSLAQINDGLLRWTPPTNANGASLASFTFQVRDDGGTANGGVDTDPTPNTITFDVTPVNDAPVNTVRGAPTGNEDDTVVLSLGTDGAPDTSIDVADAEAAVLQVTLNVTDGTLSLLSTTGLTFTSGDGIADVTMTFTGTAAAINAAFDEGIEFAPTANFYGNAQLAITTSDLGATGTPGPLTDTDTVTITINGINDAPLLDLSGPSTSAVGWTHNTPEETVMAGIRDPGRVESAEDYAVGNMAVATGQTQLEIGDFDELTFDDAVDASDYIEYVFTTAGTLPAGAILSAIRFVQPEESDTYQFGIEVSTDGFMDSANTTELVRDIEAGSDFGNGDFLVDTNDLTLIAGQTYTVRVYFYDPGCPNYDSYYWDDFRVDITDSSVNAGGLFIASVASVDRVPVSIAKGTPFDFASDAPTITDPDSTTIVSATIAIANHRVGDELIVDGTGTLPGGISASYNGTTGVLTLTGAATLDDYEAALEQISFRNLEDTVDPELRLINVTLFDDTGEASNTAVSFIAIQGGPLAADDMGTAFSDAHDSPTVSANATGDLLANDGPTATAVTSVTDATGQEVGAGVGVAEGLYGTLTFGADGSYTYVPHDSANEGVLRQSLAALFNLGQASTDTLSDRQTAYAGAHLQDVFTYSVTDGAGGTATATLTIDVRPSTTSIDAIDDAHILAASRQEAVTGSVFSNDILLEPVGDEESPAVATVTRNDVAGGVLTGTVSHVPLVFNGRYGTLTIEDFGLYSYTVDADNTEVASLAPGASLVDDFSYLATYYRGSDAAKLTFTILGAGGAAQDYYSVSEASGLTPVPYDGNVLDNGDLSNGLTNVTRILSDAGADALVGGGGVTVLGSYGSLLIRPDGSFTYTLDETLADQFSASYFNDIFTYMADDGAGGPDSAATLTFTIGWVNDPVRATPITAANVPFIDGAAPYTLKINYFGSQYDVSLQNAAFDPDNFVLDVVTGSVPTAVTATNTNGTYDITLNFIDGSDYLQVTSVTRDMGMTGLAVGEILDVTVPFDVFTVGYPDIAATSVSFRIVGDHAPVANDDTLTIQELGGTSNGGITINDNYGDLFTNDTDADGHAELRIYSVNGILAGPYGSGIFTPIDLGNGLTLIYVNAEGDYLLRVHEFDPGLDSRILGESLQVSVPYTVTDSLGARSDASLLITVNGANDAPRTVDDIRHFGALDAGATFSGPTPRGVLANDTDPDIVGGISQTDSLSVLAIQSGSASLFVTGMTTIAGLYGSLTISPDGTYAYTIDSGLASLPAGTSVTDSFIYTAIDADGLYVPANLGFHIHGGVETLQLSDDTGMAIEAGGVNNQTGGLDATGNVLLNDVGAGLTVVNAFSTIGVYGGAPLGQAISGEYGTLIMQADGDWRYVVDNNNTEIEALKLGQSLTDRFNYSVVDQFGEFDTRQLAIQIAGAEDAPRVNAKVLSFQDTDPQRTDTPFQEFNLDILFPQQDPDGDLVSFLPYAGGDIHVSVSLASIAGTIAQPVQYGIDGSTLVVDMRQFSYLQKHFSGPGFSFGDDSGTPDVLTVTFTYQVTDDMFVTENMIELDIQGTATFYGLGTTVDTIDLATAAFQYNTTIGFDDDGPLDAGYAVDILANFDNTANRIDISELLRSPGFTGPSSGDWNGIIRASYNDGGTPMNLADDVIDVFVDPDGTPGMTYAEFQIGRFAGTDTYGGGGALQVGSTIAVVFNETLPAARVTIEGA